MQIISSLFDSNVFYHQSFFSNIILRPTLVNLEPPKKRGRPKLDFSDKGYNGQYKEACEKIVAKFPPTLIFRAATIAAHQQKMKHSANIYRKLENEDAEEKALELRRAEHFYKNHPRESFLIHFTMRID